MFASCDVDTVLVLVIIMITQLLGGSSIGFGVQCNLVTHVEWSRAKRGPL